MTATLYVDPSDPRPAVHQFATKYEKLYGHAPDFAAEIGYSAVQLVVLTLQNASLVGGLTWRAASPTCEKARSDWRCWCSGAYWRPVRRLGVSVPRPSVRADQADLA
jgi:hypothetical protein